MDGWCANNPAGAKLHFGKSGGEWMEPDKRGSLSDYPVGSFDGRTGLCREEWEEGRKRWVGKGRWAGGPTGGVVSLCQVAIEVPAATIASTIRWLIRSTIAS